MINRPSENYNQIHKTTYMHIVSYTTQIIVPISKYQHSWIVSTSVIVRTIPDVMKIPEIVTAAAHLVGWDLDVNIVSY